VRYGKDDAAAIEPYGALAPGPLDKAVIAVTGCLPNNWLGVRLAILLRRIVFMRLAGDAGFDVERWGLRMRLHPRRNGCEKGALFTPQMYEAPERHELAVDIEKAKAAGRSFVFVDIGANVGLFSFFVAAFAGANARILAFEPEPENVRRLRFNIDANPGAPIRVFPLALGDTAGTLLLDIDRNDKGGTRTRRSDDREQPGDAIRVECRALSQVLMQEGIQAIDALKIDVEGAEAAILAPFFRDAPETQWPRLLIIEDTHELWPIDLFAELRARGYTVATRTKQNVMMRR
jgi:FkbM family methyltransferase